MSADKITLLAVILLGGCTGDLSELQKTNKAPTSHVCTKEQMDKAQIEAAWCNENSGFKTTYCYGAAIIRNCVPKEKP